MVEGGIGGSGGDGNPSGGGAVGKNPEGSLQYAVSVRPGINGVDGHHNASLGKGGNGGIGGAPIIEVITEAAAIRARSNLTISLQPGPFRTGTGGQGGKSGKSIGQWKGGKGGGMGGMEGARIGYGILQHQVG